MTDPTTALLFTPLTIRGVRLTNRCVFSPMNIYSSRHGCPGDIHLVHLGKMAAGGFALVFTESAAVEERGLITDHDMGIWHDGQVPAHRRIVEVVQGHGARIGIQLAHGGRKSATQRVIDGGGPLNAHDLARGAKLWQPVGPTNEPVAPGWLVPHQLSVAEIQDVVRAYAEAAARANHAGYDVAEVHGAHGYLMASFLSAVSNTRSDAYGGDRAGRMRFALEVSRAVRAVWPEGKPLFFRVSAVDGAGGWDIEDTVVLAAALHEIGVDVVDCSSGGLTGTTTTAPVPRYPGFQVPFARAVKHRAGVTAMAVGLILDGPQAEKILRDGDADLIAIGREALFNPNWPLHAARALGCDPSFRLWPERYGWWLDKRATQMALTKQPRN
jgi:2,4-dienoyl-CoA reductase-like NADH-dependent reductase (Old Yellow Enzyme family)